MSTSHWEKVPLSKIAEVRLGRQRSPKRAAGPNMRPYMRAANVTWNGISLHDVKQMDFTPQEFETYVLRRGDLLLSEASGSASEVGKPAVWNDEVPDCCFQNTLIRVRAPEPLVPFLHLHFYKDALTGEFARAARGVGIHHLGAKTLSDWEVHLPPPDEQQRIVETVDSYLTRLDHVIATLEQVHRKLQGYHASVLKAALQGRLVPTEAELARAERRDYEPASVLLKQILTERRRRWEDVELSRMKAVGKIPTTNRWKAKYREPIEPDTGALPSLSEGWCWATVDSLQWSGDYGTSQRCDSAAHGPPVVRIPNVKDGHLCLRDMKFATDRKHLRPNGALQQGDFLFVRSNGSKDLIGRGALIEHALPEEHHFASYLIRLKLAVNTTTARWLSLAWHTFPLRMQLLEGASSSAGQYNISLSAVRRYLLPIPPLHEQQRILKEVTRRLGVENQCGACVRKAQNHCERLRGSILARGLTGELFPGQ